MTKKTALKHLSQLAASSTPLFSRDYANHCDHCGEVAVAANPELLAFCARLNLLGMKFRVAVRPAKLRPGEYAWFVLTGVGGEARGHTVYFRLPAEKGGAE